MRMICRSFLVVSRLVRSRTCSRTGGERFWASSIRRPWYAPRHGPRAGAGRGHRPGASARVALEYGIRSSSHRLARRSTLTPWDSAGTRHRGDRATRPVGPAQRGLAGPYLPGELHKAAAVFEPIAQMSEALAVALPEIGSAIGGQGERRFPRLKWDRYINGPATWFAGRGPERRGPRCHRQGPRPSPWSLPQDLPQRGCQRRSYPPVIEAVPGCRASGTAGRGAVTCRRLFFRTSASW